MRQSTLAVRALVLLLLWSSYLISLSSAFLFPNLGGNSGGCCGGGGGGGGCCPAPQPVLVASNVPLNTGGSGGCSGGNCGGGGGASTVTITCGPSGGGEGCSGGQVVSSGYAQPAPTGYAQPAQGGYAQPSSGGYAQPAPTGYAQPVPTAYAQPAPTGYAQPAPTNYAQPAPTGYAQSVPAGGYAPAPASYAPAGNAAYQAQPPPAPLPPPPAPAPLPPPPQPNYSTGGGGASVQGQAVQEVFPEDQNRPSRNSSLSIDDSDGFSATQQVAHLAASFNESLLTQPQDILEPIDVTQLNLTSNPDCNSEELRTIVLTNMSEDLNTSKRLIQLASEQKFGGRFDVICSANDFSYVTNTELWCQETTKTVSCYAYRQLG